VNKARAYPPDHRDVMLKKMYTVFDKFLNTDPSVDIKRVLKCILSGYDVKGDIKYSRLILISSIYLSILE